MVKIKMNDRALKKLAEDATSKAEQAVNDVLAKSKGKSESQIASEIKRELKKVGVEPDDSVVRKIAKEAAK